MIDFLVRNSKQCSFAWHLAKQSNLGMLSDTLEILNSSELNDNTMGHGRCYPHLISESTILNSIILKTLKGSWVENTFITIILVNRKDPMKEEFSCIQSQNRI